MFLVLVGLAVAYFGCILGLFICAALHSQWPLVQAGCYLSWVAADFAQFFLHLGVFFVIVGIAVAHFWLHSCSVHLCGSAFVAAAGSVWMLLVVSCCCRCSVFCIYCLDAFRLVQGTGSFTVAILCKKILSWCLSGSLPGAG